MCTQNPPLLVVAYKHVDERTCDYCDNNGYSRNDYALFPLFLVHFVCRTVTHRKVNYAGCADKRSDHKKHV